MDASEITLAIIRMSTRFEIIRAREVDLDPVIAVLDAAAEWLVMKGVAGPWRPGSFSRQAFATQIARGEVYVAKLGEENCGDNHASMER